MSNYNHLKFGCEFEFYPNIMLEDEMIDTLSNILKDGVVLKQNLKSNDDNNMNYKTEPSLTDSHKPFLKLVLNIL